jgi:hypothetical protein
MRVERDDYRGQLRRRETDFENRTKAEHSNTVRQLESRLETDDIVRTKAKEAEARSTAEADRLRHELASERITHEGELRERERAATSKFNIAMGTKDRMILKRESKIEEANVKTLEAIEDKERVERELGCRIDDRNCGWRLPGARVGIGADVWEMRMEWARQIRDDLSLA